MKDDILNALAQILKNTPHSNSNQKRVFISNKEQIERYDKNYAKFRSEIDPRDLEIIHPFAFSINSLSGSYSHQKIVQTPEYKQIVLEIHQFLAEMCENVVSISFRLLNDGKLTENETKDFASKNILGNVESILTKVLKEIKAIIKKQDIEEFAFKITLQIDETLMEVLKNLSSYYPQAPAAGNTAKMREVIVNVNRSQDETTDLIFNCGIKIDNYIRRKSWQSGEILNSYEEYTGFIMEVINATISVTRQNAAERSEETVFEKFVSFSERLFCTSQHKYYKPLMNTLIKNKNSTENEEELLLKYYKKVLEGEQIEVDQNWALQSLGYVKDFFSFFGVKKDTKQTKNEKKMNTSQYLEFIKSQYDEELEKMKKAPKHAISQKIPTYVKPFTRNDLKQNNFFVNNSAVLRIMTKWAQKLEQIFVKSEIIIKQREYYFKNIKNEMVPPNEGIKNALHQKLAIQYKTVKKEFNKLKEKNTILQSYFLTQGKYDSQNSYLKRYTNARCTASKINATLIESMRKYLCILIHHLLRAGSDIQTGSKKEHINLVVFQVNDLLRSKFQCNESTFINILNTLYLLDKSTDMRDKFKLVRVKNKLDQKDNNILINYMFLGKVQCELQLSIQDMKTKQKNSYNFNHFVYELTRGKFGAITQCAIIVSQHDPIVNSCTKGMYYIPKKNQKLEKFKPGERSPIQFRRTCKKDSNLFVCLNCKKFIINDNGQLFESKENICNRCIMKKDNPEVFIKNRQIQRFLTQNASKALKKITNYSQIENEKFVITMSCHGKKKDTMKLFKAWYHPREFKLFLIQINSFILTQITNSEKFEYEDFDYMDIQEDLQKRQKINELAYILEEKYIKEVADLLFIEKESLANIPKITEKFENYRIEENLVKALRFRSEIIDLSGDKQKLGIFNLILQRSKNRNKKDHLKYRKYRNLQFSNLKTITLDKLDLSKIPINLGDLKNLTRINVEQNNITSVDLTHITSLNNLDLSNNQLTLIDLTKNTALFTVDVSDNKLQSINLTKNHDLFNLDLRKNSLIHINIANCQLLTHLNLSKNNIYQINLTHNVNLVSLNLGNNKIKDIDLSCNINLIELSLNNNFLEELKLTENVDLASLYLFNNVLTFIDLTKNIGLTNLSLHSNCIQAIDLTENINLANLNLYKNKITQIYLIRNINLTSINLYNNALTEIDLTKNAALCSLNLYKNLLSQIDLSRNHSLSTLDLSYNRLKSINLSRNVNIGSLDLRNNDLSSLDLSNNLQLFNLSLQFNKLSNIIFVYCQQFNLSNVDLRNQLSERSDILLYHKKAEEPQCNELVKRLSMNLNYKKCRLSLAIRN